MNEPVPIPDACVPTRLPSFVEPDWAQAAEARLLDEAIGLAASTPWNDALVAQAARAGLGEADAQLLLPAGARDLAALLSRRHDAAALEALGPLDPRLKVRERISQAVQARIEAAMVDESAVRRCSLYLARPDHLALATRLAWESADQLWRWAGDTATDENHYSKRAILAGILISTLAVRLSAGRARAEAFLEARIDGVMRFERWKAGFPAPTAGLAGMAAILGRLRYSALSPDGRNA